MYVNCYFIIYRLGVGIKTRMMCTVHKYTACTIQCMGGGVVKRVTMYVGVTTYQYSEWGCGPIIIYRMCRYNVWIEVWSALIIMK